LGRGGSREDEGELASGPRVGSEGCEGVEGAMLAKESRDAEGVKKGIESETDEEGREFA